MNRTDKTSNICLVLLSVVSIKHDRNKYCIRLNIFFFFTDSNLTTKDKTAKGKGCTNDNHQRLSAGVEDKEMDSLRKWFSDKLALGLGNKDLMEKPKVYKIYIHTYMNK